MSRLSALLALPPLGAGLAVAAWLIAGAPGPAQVQAPAEALAVRVAPVRSESIRPVVKGWGVVRPAETWTAVAEVRGQVVWIHPDLQEGRVIAAGTEVLRIDPADYELAIAQAEADLMGLEAEAGQIAAEAENTERILVLEQERLRLAEADLARVRELVAQGASPSIRADEAERALLQVRRSVAELQNGLSLTPSRQARLAAQRARTQAALDRARRDLAHSVLTTPFDLRVGDVAVDLYQSVGVGQSLIRGDGLDRAEVLVQVPLPAFRRLLLPLDLAGDPMAALRDGPSLGISAELHPLGDPAQVWQAELSRIEGALDPRAHSVPVVLDIPRPYADAAPPLRMPLVANMQVEVTLSGAGLDEMLTAPEAGLHGEHVYLAAPDDTLEMRPVEPLFRQDGKLVVREGLSPGERVVIDDLAPAIPGMRLLALPAEP